ncbi:MAG: archaeal proteasome endopeptidase complex subunit beta [Thermoplasmata archaeon]
MTEPSKEVRSGTTTLGLVCKDGVVLAAEKRATMGTLIAHKVTKKIFRLDENLGITTAGLVGDLQALTRYITAEVELYRLKRGMPMPVEACATLTSNILSGRRFFPYLVQLVIGGVDIKGNHVYSIDLAGGAIPDKYVTTGSGSPFVYGVLEDQYKENLSADAGVDLAVRAVTAAMKRDAASGDGIDIVKIQKEGYFEVSEEEIEKRKQKLKLS